MASDAGWTLPERARYSRRASRTRFPSDIRRALAASAAWRWRSGGSKSWVLCMCRRLHHTTARRQAARGPGGEPLIVCSPRGARRRPAGIQACPFGSPRLTSDVRVGILFRSRSGISTRGASRGSSERSSILSRAWSAVKSDPAAPAGGEGRFFAVAEIVEILIDPLRPIGFDVEQARACRARI